jgi:hypothetical protein
MVNESLFFYYTTLFHFQIKHNAEVSADSINNTAK